MSRATKVLIDTNLFIRAMRGSQPALELFRAAKAGVIVPVLSYKLALEYGEIAEQQAEGIKPGPSDFVLDVVESDSLLRRDPALTAMQPLSDDPEDDFVVALARSTGALLITDDQALLNTMAADIPRVGFFDAVESLRAHGTINVALADRYGKPYLQAG